MREKMRLEKLSPATVLAGYGERERIKREVLDDLDRRD